MWDKIKQAWIWLDGKKRRIALLGELASQIAPNGSTVYYVGKSLFYLFGAVDMAQVGTSQLKKLPTGLRKQDN